MVQLLLRSEEISKSFKTSKLDYTMECNLRYFSSDCMKIVKFVALMCTQSTSMGVSVVFEQSVRKERLPLRGVLDRG